MEKSTISVKKSHLLIIREQLEILGEKLMPPSMGIMLWANAVELDKAISNMMENAEGVTEEEMDRFVELTVIPMYAKDFNGVMVPPKDLSALFSVGLVV